MVTIRLHLADQPPRRSEAVHAESYEIVQFAMLLAEQPRRREEGLRHRLSLPHRGEGAGSSATERPRCVPFHDEDGVTAAPVATSQERPVRLQGRQPHGIA
jgi:hypothetical protein